jgi:hypothetical protein
MDITHQPPEQAHQSPFAEPEVPENPFLTPPEPEPDEPVELHKAPEGTPSWNDFVAFVLDFGNVLRDVEYPSPKADCVDTCWAGVPVSDGPRARVRHKKAGWVDWEDAIKGTRHEFIRKCS